MMRLSEQLSSVVIEGRDKPSKEEMKEKGIVDGTGMSLDDVLMALVKDRKSVFMSKKLYDKVPSVLKKYDLWIRGVSPFLGSVLVLTNYPEEKVKKFLDGYGKSESVDEATAVGVTSFEVPPPPPLARQAEKARKTPAKSKGLPDATVRTWLMVLRSKLTQYDRKESMKELKRSGNENIYRLGHLLGAAERVENDVKALLDRSDEEAITAFEQAMNKAFESGFPPVNNVKKQIVKFLDKGTMPSLVASMDNKSDIFEQLEEAAFGEAEIDEVCDLLSDETLDAIENEALGEKHYDDVVASVLEAMGAPDELPDEFYVQLGEADPMMGKTSLDKKREKRREKRAAQAKYGATVKKHAAKVAARKTFGGKVKKFVGKVASGMKMVFGRLVKVGK